MTFRKTLSSIIILSQLSWSALPSVVLADPAAAQGASPEQSLLSSVISLEGQKLLTPQLAQQIQAKFDQYDAQAPRAGRLDRIEQALVTMGIYTPSQMGAVESQVQSASQKLLSTSFASPQQAQQALETQVTQIAAEASGAQFSSCDADTGMLTAGIAVFLGAAIATVALNPQNVFNQGNFPIQDGWLGGVALGGIALAIVGAFKYGSGFCDN